MMVVVYCITVTVYLTLVVEIPATTQSAIAVTVSVTTLIRTPVGNAVVEAIIKVTVL
tara:strand:- start:986 stop:1156 length:171 start_codon:yes stop_codon:yes gene_type:complete